MGKVHCGMQTQQWNNGIVKNVTQTMPHRHKDATIFHYVHCVSLSIFKDGYLTSEHIYMVDFTDLDAVYGSDNGLKMKFTYVKHLLFHLEKCLSQLIMKQTIVNSPLPGSVIWVHIPAEKKLQQPEFYRSVVGGLTSFSSEMSHLFSFAQSGITLQLRYLLLFHVNTICEVDLIQ